MRGCYHSLVLLSFLAGVAITGAVKCYSCSGIDCENSECTGEYCYDKFTNEKKISQMTWNRGCYNAEAGHASKPDVSGGFQCDSRLLDYLNQSTCVCQTDFCNNKTFHYDSSNQGQVTCALGKEGQIRTTCTGDSCRFGQGMLGIGCQYNKNSFVDDHPLFPPPSFNGCYKVHKEDNTDMNEQCSCTRDNCNRVNPNVTYSRATVIDCQEQEKFSPDVKTCSGNACFIMGIKTPVLNGYTRGCIMASGKDDILPFCTSTQGIGSSDYYDSCLCLTDNCNKDINTAKVSMTPTTTTSTTITTAITESPTTKAANQILPTILIGSMLVLMVTF